MSVSERKIKKIRVASCASIEQEVKANRKKVAAKRHKLDEVQQRLNKVEEKWFKDKLNKDTYESVFYL
ncbi:hypothetical protein ACFPVY_02390 [Flavobacterium qiangtangense]|uniref:Uncharacterized protein n=1 Tax=Flavobacterium qiangtangense TaxID=1442595 RepID=A0ABW1PKE6_9FLAO